jgi:hypothetical protein
MLIENWKQAYKMASIWVTSIVAFLAGLEPFIPKLAEFLPEGWVFFAALLIIAARLAKQKKLHDTTPKELWDETMRKKDLS